MKIKRRHIVREVRRSIGRLTGGVAIASQHLQLLRANLRYLRHIEREEGDALRARLATLEERCDASGEIEVGRWLQEWDAIEHSWTSRANKRTALRTLYVAAIERVAQAESICSQSVQSAPAKRTKSMIGARVSVGDVIDKLTCLELELANISGEEARECKYDYDVLTAALARALVPSEALNALRAELKTINAERREAEVRLRDCERAANFGEAFVESVRAARCADERRVELRRRIDELVRGVV